MKIASAGCGVWAGFWVGVGEIVERGKAEE